MIERSGKCAPSMQVAVLAQYGEVGITTDPDEQRIGCDYISTEMAIEHVGGLLGQILGTRTLVLNRDCDRTKLKDKLSRLGHHAKAHFSRINDETLKECIKLFDRLLIDNERAASWLGTENLDLDAILEDSRAFMEVIHRHFVQFAPELDPCPYTLITTHRKAIKRGFEIACLQQSADVNSLLRKILTFLASLASLVHLEIHSGCIPENATHVVVQGAGDISMNLWNIAAISEEGGLRLIHAHQENVESRQYSCLLAFKEDVGANMTGVTAKTFGGDIPRAGKLAIGRVRLNRYMPRPEQVQLVLSDGNTSFIGEEIDYAIYGQCLVWKNVCKTPHEVVREFSDIRHILHMPSLNPSWNHDESRKWIQKAREDKSRPSLPACFFSEKLEHAFACKPRFLFGVPAVDEVWLGEHAFLKNPEILSAACDHPVEIPLADLGAPLDWVTVCMRAYGCTWRSSTDSVQTRGEFAWNLLDPTDPRLVWFPDVARYPCTLVGVGKIRERTSDRAPEAPAVFLLAWGHAFDEDQRYSIFECARVLRDLGADAVLLIDEGKDVFQYYFSSSSVLREYVKKPPFPRLLLSRSAASSEIERLPCPVPPSREQIRGSLSFWIEAMK
jgi:hypothetical protein